MTASVAVSRTPAGVLNYHNAGKVQASSEPQDMRLQRMLGHLTTLVPDNPRRVLVIGCGAGVTAGAVSVDPTRARARPLPRSSRSCRRSCRRISPSTTSTSSRNPKVNVHLDDARHYLLTTKEKFDAITSDPLDPWVKGAATLYTREFFQVVKEHLNPGGVVTLFVQLYESNDAAVKSEIATFLEAFPDGVVFANTSNGQGYDLVLLGQLEPRPINVDAVQARLTAAVNAPIAQSLSEIGIYSATDLFGTYAGRKSDMAGWLSGARDQSRPQPAAAVSGGARPEPLSERRHLPEHDRGQPVSRRSLRGIAGHAAALRKQSSRRWRISRRSRELRHGGQGARGAMRRRTVCSKHRNRPDCTGGRGRSDPFTTTVPGRITPPFGTTMIPPRMYQPSPSAWSTLRSFTSRAPSPMRAFLSMIARSRTTSRPMPSGGMPSGAAPSS